MIQLLRGSLAAVVLLLATPRVSAAQIADIPGFDRVIAQIQERLADNRYLLREAVEMEQGGMRFYADLVEYFGDTNRMVATGNVLLIETDHLIAADRADFNAKTRLGTFFNARGFATMGAAPDDERRRRTDNTSGMPEPDVQFYGETLEKTGFDTYVITNGGFTSCVQASPRWEMTSGSLKLRVDHYALLRNMMLKVKGVPALYLPIMYYPLSKDNRNTGFLMPSYGSSSYKGQTISNAFFWAINRSQDATILHDWYSKTGQAIAGEYRYVSLGGFGNVRSDFLDEHPATFETASGGQVEQEGRRSFRANGNMSQALSRRWNMQARADYSSDLTVDQLYSSDIIRASRRTRNLGASISGTTKGLRIGGTYDRNEYFAENGTSSLRGNSPRITVTRPDRLIGSLPIYASFTSEYLNLKSDSYNADHQRTRQDGLTRIDFTPAVRFPFNKLPFLAFTTSAQFRNTWWSESLAVDPLTGLSLGERVKSPISRRFLELSSDVNGPTIVKIFDAPNNSYAQRFRHSIEPFAQVLYRTPIDNFEFIPKLESSDRIVGAATSLSYGFNTRFYAKRTVDGPKAIPREVVSATVRQTYNTDSRSVLSDAQYRSRNEVPASNFTPVTLLVRSSPWVGVSGNFRTDWDGRYSRFRQFSSDATWEHERISLLAGWSQVRFRPDSRTGENVARQSHYFNSATTLRFQQNRYGLIHTMNWDVRLQSILQQRFAGYYNAQCCGFSAEYQFFDLTRLGSNSPVPQDSRFHFSVTLGGIGNVSNIFGALGGAADR